MTCKRNLPLLVAAVLLGVAEVLLVVVVLGLTFAAVFSKDYGCNWVYGFRFGVASQL